MTGATNTRPSPQKALGHTEEQKSIWWNSHTHTQSLQSAELAGNITFFHFSHAFNTTAFLDLHHRGPGNAGALADWSRFIFHRGLRFVQHFWSESTGAFCTAPGVRACSFREKSSELSWHSAACSTSTDHFCWGLQKVPKNCGKPARYSPFMSIEILFSNTDPKTGIEQIDLCDWIWQLRKILPNVFYEKCKHACVHISMRNAGLLKN